MHLMTRLPAGAGIHAPFAADPGQAAPTFRFKDDTARLVERDGERYVDLTSAQYGDHRYRITRVIGGRYREDFAGVEVGGSDARELAAPGLVRVRDAQLPPQGLLGDGRRAARPARGRRLERDLHLLPQHGAVLRRAVGRAGGPGRAGLPGRGGRPPAAARAALALRGRRGRRRAAAERRRRRGRGRRGHAARATATIGAPRSAHGIRELRSRFGARNFVEIGIGCEACHGGSREHVVDPRVHPAFAPRSAFLQRAAGGGRRRRRAPSRSTAPARAATRCCSRAIRSPGRAEARRGGKPGGSSITSGEARDFLLGGCARQMSCATCHDPHAEDRRADLDRLATTAGNAVCVRCHPQYAPAPALAAHAHHDPSGRGRQLHRLPHAEEEHGPRLRADALPPHRAARRSGARRARSAARVRALPRRQDRRGAGRRRWKRWWGRKYDRAALADSTARSTRARCRATLMRGKAHEQAVARGGAGRGAPDGGAARRSRASSRTRSRSCATTRSARSTRWRRGRAPSISIGRHPRSSRRCGPASRRPSPTRAGGAARQATHADR